MATVPTFFSQNAGLVVAVLLLLVLILAIYALGPTAIARWLG